MSIEAITRNDLSAILNEVLPPQADALEWKLKGTVTGANTIALPTEYSEIMLVATYSTYHFSAIIPKAEISASYIYPRFASYYNTSNNAGGYFTLNNASASIGNFSENNGTNRLPSATFKLYYR